MWLGHLSTAATCRQLQRQRKRRQRRHVLNAVAPHSRTVALPLTSAALPCPAVHSPRNLRGAHLVRVLRKKNYKQFMRLGCLLLALPAPNPSVPCNCSCVNMQRMPSAFAFAVNCVWGSSCVAGTIGQDRNREGERERVMCARIALQLF